MARDPQLYIIDSDAIQGQAGKPFSHDPGTKLRFPTDNVQVNNRCLCNYRYYQYFAFYQYLPNTPYSNSIQFYLLQPTDEGYRLQTDQNQLFTFDTYIGLGYQWKLHSGPVYLGCHPAGTYQTGKWLPINLPYTGFGGGITQPAPRYVQINQFHQGSLKCMFVTNYKCCNGVQGCGISIGGSQDSSQSFENFDLPFFAADFYITGLMGDQPTAKLIKGTQRCEPNGGRLTKTYIRHTCDAATATGWYAFNLMSQQQDDRLQQCNVYCQASETRDQAAESAIAYARERIKGRQCVYWILWRFIIPVCYDPCSLQDTQWNIVGAAQEWATVPADVTGKGPGWLFPDEHTTQRIIKCEQHTVYQWASVSMEAYKEAERQFTDPQHQPIGELLLSTMPQPLTQNPCADACGYNKQLAGFGFEDSSTSGSISGSGVSDTPCNSPDPYYKVFLDYQHQQFDLYYLELTKKQLDPALFNPELDPCKEYYTPQTQTDADGKRKLKWHDDGTQLYDYNLLQRGRIRGTTFLRWNKDKSKFYLVVPTGQDPPQNQSDPRLKDFHFLSDSIFIQDPNSNKCQGVYQCYYMGCKCPDPCSDSCSESQKVPLITGGCFKWAYIGRISDESLLQRGICTDNWQQSTQERTGSQPPIGIAVFTTNSDDPHFCDDYPKPPSSVLQYVKVTARPTCTQGSDSFQVQVMQQDLPLCGQTSAMYFGWKKVDSLSNSQLLPIDPAFNFYIDAGNACQIYYFKLLHNGLVLYDANCNSDLPQQITTSQVFSDAMPLIKWNHPVCMQWVKKYRWNVYTVSPDPEDSNANLVEGPEQVYKQLPWSDASTPTWGWVDKQDPFIAESLLQDDTAVLPMTQSMTQSDSTLCTVYYLQLLYSGEGCPGQDNDQEQGDQIEHPDDDDQDLGVDQEESPEGGSSNATLFIGDLVNQPISWDRQYCLTSFCIIRYVYAEIQLSCDTLSNSQWYFGLPRPPNTLDWEGPQQLKFQIEGQFSESFHWGWLDSNTPYGTPLISTGAYTVNPVTTIDAASDSYLCTIYYVHKVAEYRGHSQDPDQSKFWHASNAEPDLSGYTVNWNEANCIPQFTGKLAYYAATFQPTCSNSSGRIDPNKIDWGDLRVVQIQRHQQIAGLITGWASSDDPTSAQPLAGAGQYVIDPGDLCTIYYIQLVGLGYFCDQNLIPRGWPFFSGEYVNLDGYSISWNRRKCLEQCNWYVYKQSIITQQCSSNSAGYINVPSGGYEPIAISQCGSNASNALLPTGYFVNRSNSWIPANILNGTIILNESDACQVLHRICVFNGFHRGQPQQSELIPFDPNSLRNTQIAWPTYCEPGNTYIRYAYKTLQATCKTPSPTGQWKFSTYIGDNTQDVIAGWHSGQSIKQNLLPIVNSQAIADSCKATYVHIISSYQACKQLPTTDIVPPQVQAAIPAVVWPSECIAKSKFWYWQACKIEPACSNAGGIYTEQPTSDLVPRQDNTAIPTTGYYYIVPPSVNGKISLNANSAVQSCFVYDVRIQQTSGCSQSDAYGSVQKQTFTGSHNFAWPTSCLNLKNYITWMQAQLVPVCSDAGRASVYNWSQASSIWDIGQPMPKVSGVDLSGLASNYTTIPNGCTVLQLSSITSGIKCKNSQVPVLGSPAASSIPYNWEDSCLISKGWHWYQNYAIYTYSQDCTRGSDATSYCSAGCSSANNKYTVYTSSRWLSSGGCAASRIAPIGEVYLACTSITQVCPSDSVGYAFGASCGGKWWQNFVLWTYSKNCSTGQISSKCQKLYASGSTASQVFNYYDLGWTHSGQCFAWHTERVGSPYSACASSAIACTYPPQYSTTSDCKRWHQNYVVWTYSNNNCSISSSITRSGCFTGDTSQSVLASFGQYQTWTSTGCKQIKYVSAGSAYSACDCTSDYSGATVPGDPGNWDSSCCSISCNGSFDYTIYGPDNFDDTAWSPSSITCNFGYKIYATTNDSSIDNSYGVWTSVGFAFRWRDEAVLPAEIGFQIDSKNCEIMLINWRDGSTITVPLAAQVTGTAGTELSPQAEAIHGIRTVTVIIHIQKCN